MQEWADTVKFTYGVVDVDKNSPLGTGSYGAVYRAKCDDLQCAAKVVHEALLINDPAGGRGGVVDRFYQECHFLSELKHPNIVQYLGTHCERVTSRLSVVLLMELMDESLTRHLERMVSPLPLHVELDFCCDIALALSYLHSNHVVHRDLTGNNVLLYGGKKAKVTDFGVSKLIDPEVLQRSSMSLCPGTTVYMPPEALEEVKVPKYTEKLDCFSYGVLCIQIFTRKFPSPSSRYKTIDSGSGDSSQRIRAVNIVSESVRRRDHIQMVQSDHIFLPTTL
jgi:serine/threonine protein kinase